MTWECIFVTLVQKARSRSIHDKKCQDIKSYSMTLSEGYIFPILSKFAYFFCCLKFEYFKKVKGI